MSKHFTKYARERYAYVTHTLAYFMHTLLIRSHTLCIRYSYARIRYANVTHTLPWRIVVDSSGLTLKSCAYKQVFFEIFIRYSYVLSYAVVWLHLKQSICFLNCVGVSKTVIDSWLCALTSERGILVVIDIWRQFSTGWDYLKTKNKNFLLLNTTEHNILIRKLITQ